VFFELHDLLVSKQADYGPDAINRAPGGPLNGINVRIHDKVRAGRQPGVQREVDPRAREGARHLQGPGQLRGHRAHGHRRVVARMIMRVLTTGLWITSVTGLALGLVIWVLPLGKLL
jgi:hypothetical protein